MGRPRRPRARGRRVSGRPARGRLSRSGGRCPTRVLRAPRRSAGLAGVPSGVPVRADPPRTARARPNSRTRLPRALARTAYAVRPCLPVVDLQPLARGAGSRGTSVRPSGSGRPYRSPRPGRYDPRSGLDPRGVGQPGRVRRPCGAGSRGSRRPARGVPRPRARELCPASSWNASFRTRAWTARCSGCPPPPRSRVAARGDRC